MASSSDLLELVMSGHLPVRKGSVKQDVQTDSQEDRTLNDHPPKKTPLQFLTKGRLIDGVQPRAALGARAGCVSVAQSSSQVRSCGCSEACYEKVDPRCCRSQGEISE